MIALGMVVQTGPALAASYVDAALGEIKPADKVVIASPQPVQLLFEFETKGALNGRATKLLKDQVVAAVKASGLFSDVSDTPTANGAVLEIIINDSPSKDEMDEAYGKGFVTGATFFIAGNTIRENYLCTINYVAGPTATKITRTAADGVYFQMGLINSPPANAVKIGSLHDAVFAMTRLIIINPLNALAADPGFQLAMSTAPASTAAPGQAMAATPLALPPTAVPVAATAPAPAPSPAPAVPPAANAPSAPAPAAPTSQPAPANP
ncbi:MAG TPA: hypothetical protein VHZ26_03280 [Caulobacteraceae bacterium]|nr:hypothetical protein [Caulobacteraceae bacterium]